MEENIIETDVDGGLMIFMLEWGVFGEIQTDENKIDTITSMLSKIFYDVEDVIRMCAKWYLNKIKEEGEDLSDGEVMFKLGKLISKELKERWL